MAHFKYGQEAKLPLCNKEERPNFSETAKSARES